MQQYKTRIKSLDNFETRYAATLRYYMYVDMYFTIAMYRKNLQKLQKTAQLRKTESDRLQNKYFYAAQLQKNINNFVLLTFAKNQLVVIKSVHTKQLIQSIGQKIGRLASVNHVVKSFDEKKKNLVQMYFLLHIYVDIRTNF